MAYCVPNPSLLAPVSPRDDVDLAYRAAVSAFSTAWRDSASGWESRGHLDREMFRDAGRRGLFEQRWAAGQTAGLPLGLELLRGAASLTTGAALGVSLHCEVFINALYIAHQRWGLAEAELQAALRGDRIGCFAVTEHTGGSDVLNVASMLDRSANRWRLTGEKRYISNASVATHALVVARDGPTAGRLAAVMLPLDREGVHVVGRYPKMGTHGADACHLRFDTEVDESMVLGPRGAGLSLLMTCLEFERLAVSSVVLSIGWGALRLARAYMRERQQFGGRLYDKQALRHRLVDAWSALEAAQSLLDHTVADVMAQRVHSHATAIAKLEVTRTVGRVVDECVQFLGGRGYSANYPLERYYRDVRLARIGSGTDEVMRELVGTRLDSPDPLADECLGGLADGDRAEAISGPETP